MKTKLLFSSLVCTGLALGVSAQVTISEAPDVVISEEVAATFNSTHEWPTGLAWDGEHFWSSGSDVNEILKLDKSGKIISSIPSPAKSNSEGASGMEFDGKNLWVVVEQEGMIYKIDPATGNTLTKFELPSYGEEEPNGWGIAWDGEYLWHSQYNPGAIYKLDPKTGEVLATLTVNERVFGVDFIGENLYAVTRDGLFKVDQEIGELEHAAKWDISYPLGITCDGSSIWGISSNKAHGGEQSAIQFKFELPEELVVEVVEETILEEIPTIESKVVKVPVLEEVALSVPAVTTPTKSEIIIPSAENGISLTVYPNPLSESGIIEFTLPEAKKISLRVNDILGKEVFNLLEANREKGTYKEDLNVSNLKSGLYFVTLRVGNEVSTARVVVNH
jgi:glutamine cyclotransferase